VGWVRHQNVPLYLNELPDRSVSNIAAHKTGRTSLDFRLRDATPLRDRIVKLLEELEELIEEGNHLEFIDSFFEHSLASYPPSILILFIFHQLL
jgi:hypothetical protein